MENGLRRGGSSGGLATAGPGRYDRGMVGKSQRTRAGVCTTAACAALFAATSTKAWSQEPQAAAPPSCTKTDFEAVVDEAGEALRNLNQEKKPEFEDRLRALKDKRGWAHEEFLKAAAPFVKDEAIDVFDAKSNSLLEKLSAAGDAKPASKVPDCATLLELRAQMKVLVETQNEKWTYMFGKLDTELQK